MGAGSSCLARPKRRLRRVYGRRCRQSRQSGGGFSIKRCLRPLWAWVKRLRVRKRLRVLYLEGVAAGRRTFGRRVRRHASATKCDEDRDLVTERWVQEGQQNSGEWSLFPGLPHEIGLQCLARVPRACFPQLRAVCKPWRWTVETDEFLELRQRLGSAEDWLYLHVGTAPRFDQQPAPRERERERERSTWKMAGGFSVWRALDPGALRWHPLPPIPYDSAVTGDRVVLGASSAVLDGRLYVVGGAPFGKEAMRDVWVYHPLRNRWRRAPSMVTPRFKALLGVIGKNLYVVGGSGVCQLAGYSLPCLEVYSPDTDSWHFAASARGVATTYPCNPLEYVAVLDDKLCVIGSQTHRGRINSGAYDPVENTWEEISPALRTGWGCPSTVMDGNLYTVQCGYYQQYMAVGGEWTSLKGELNSEVSLQGWDPRLVSAMAGRNGKLYMASAVGKALVVVIAPVLDEDLETKEGRGIRWHAMKLPSDVDFFGDFGHCTCQVIGF